MADNTSNNSIQNSEETIGLTLGATSAPKYYPTIAPIDDVRNKSLDFAFNNMSYAFSYLQKHNDDKHATLTITYTNNLMFNGQLLGESVELPFDDPASSSNPYGKGNNSYKHEAYFATYYIHNANIHTFRIEGTYNRGQDNTYASSFGIVSRNWFHSDNGHSYAYILNFDRGVLKYSIYDNKNNKFVQTYSSDFSTLKNPTKPFGGDRLIWDAYTNKYLLNQFGVTTVDSDDTDPIPAATTSNDGLMSKSSYSYVYSKAGELRTDVDALKKVTQAPCAYYVDFDNSPLFYRSASTGLKTTTYAHNNFWDQLLNISSTITQGLQIIGYSNNPKTGGAASYTYINASSVYFGCLCNTIAGDNSYFINTHYTYNSRIYSSYIYMSSALYNHSTGNKLSYLMMAYVSPLNMQEITSSNEGTFTK